MRYLLIALYIAGWLATTVALVRATPTADEGSRGHRLVLQLVSGACAVALAVVWPLSALFLPLIRAAFNRNDDE